MTLSLRPYEFRDINEIKRNDYALSNQDGFVGLLISLNDVFAESVVDDDGRVHALLFCGRCEGSVWHDDYKGKWYVFAVYADGCSRLVVRVVRKRLAKLMQDGYDVITVNDDDSLVKFHDVLFRGL